MLQPDSVLLLDVMSTLVYDPFPVEMTRFFGMSLDQMMARRHPTAWVDFEHGRLEEDAFYATFFQGKPVLDGALMRQMLFDTYRYLDGIEALLTALKARGVPMYALSNYPVWYELIEQKLELSRWLDGGFVSYQMGHRKPAPQAYLVPATRLNVAPERCIFVDDRASNCQGARQVGMQAIVFDGADKLAAALGL